VVELGVALWFPCVLWNCMRWEKNPEFFLLAYTNVFLRNG
jgi:hypothetical protein